MHLIELPKASQQCTSSITLHCPQNHHRSSEFKNQSDRPHSVPRPKRSIEAQGKNPPLCQPTMMHQALKTKQVAQLQLMRDQVLKVQQVAPSMHLIKHLACPSYSRNLTNNREPRGSSQNVLQENESSSAERPNSEWGLCGNGWRATRSKTRTPLAAETRTSQRQVKAMSITSHRHQLQAATESAPNQRSAPATNTNNSRPISSAAAAKPIRRCRSAPVQRAPVDSIDHFRSHGLREL